MFKPSYTFRNRDNSNVALSPSMKDEKGNVIVGNPIFINAKQRFVPRNELEQTYLLKHKRVLSGSIIAERIVQTNPIAPKPNLPSSDEIVNPLAGVVQKVEQEGEVLPDAESTITEPIDTVPTDEPVKESDEALFEKATQNARESMINSVINLPTAINVMKDLGFTEKFNRGSDLKAFALSKGIRFPNWK